jgi:2-polyprenyl-3-methyl-5-hydroxy-6-metoxy-1,4-benzoquinol methylase
MKPTEIQESLYSFAYHFLPTENTPKTWHVARYLYWGYEYLAILETVRTLVVRNQPERVLDFGCGDGRLIQELAKDGIPELLGVDHSEHALLFAHAALYGYNNVHFLKELQEIDDSLMPINMITAIEVLEHISPHLLKDIIKQFWATIHQDGILIVSVPTVNIPLNKKHYQHFSIEKLNDCMQGLFLLTEFQFIHKVCFLSELIRKMVVNRVFIMNNANYLKLMTSIYRRFVMNADDKTGAHMICLFRRC